MKVVLINPPSPFLINQKSFIPLGLLALAGYIRQETEHEVQVLDLSNEEGRLAAALKEFEGDVLGVSATTPQYPHACAILSALRQVAPKATAVIGGVHASCVPDRCVADGWDYVVVGEGERAIVRLLDTLRQGTAIARIIPAQVVEDPDTLPFPAYEAVDLAQYGYDIDGHKALTAITSRGCPFECSFCSKDVWPRKVRFHSPEYVERMVRHIRQDLQYQYLQLLDDTLVLKKDRLLEICRLLDPLDVRFRCYGHVRGCTSEVLHALKRAGCVEIGIGIESGSQRILDAVGKPATIEENLAMVERCREAGIASNVFIMIGLPGESRETVAETHAWMERARPDKFGYNIFMPYLGTPIYNHPERYDIQLFPVEEEHAWVKGRQGEYHAYVATSALTREEIIELFTAEFQFFTELTRWRPGYNERLVRAD